MFSRRIIVIIGSILIASFSAHIYGQLHRAIYTGAIERSSEYHSRGSEVLGQKVFESIGGVLSQTTILGNPVAVSIAPGPPGTYPGYIMVHRDYVQAMYEIDYEDLVPMALFVDSGGTSLYTLWEDNELPRNFRYDAGFIEHPNDGLVALEFGGTHYADALYFLDTCEGCIGLSNDNLADKLNEDIFRSQDFEAIPNNSYISYINTDVALDFPASIYADRWIIEGNIARLYWRMSEESPNGIVISSAKMIVRPDELSINIDRRLDEISKDMKSLKDWRTDVSKLQETQILQMPLQWERGEHSRRKLADAFFLFETLALLRSAKETSSEKWSTFMQALSSEAIVNTNREPWERYTRSVCLIYQDDIPECSDWR